MTLQFASNDDNRESRRTLSISVILCHLVASMSFLPWVITSLPAGNVNYKWLTRYKNIGYHKLLISKSLSSFQVIYYAHYLFVTKDTNLTYHIISTFRWRQFVFNMLCTLFQYLWQKDTNLTYYIIFTFR